MRSLSDQVILAEPNGVASIRLSSLRRGGIAVSMSLQMITDSWDGHRASLFIHPGGATIVSIQDNEGEGRIPIESGLRAQAFPGIHQGEVIDRKSRES